MMKQEDEILSSTNSWQNIGICTQLMRDKIQPKYWNVYLEIVSRSFGYGQSKTNRYIMKEWCKWLKITKPTFIKHIHWLSDNNFIEIIQYQEYVVDGGSKPFAYAPTFPHKIDKKYGLINIKDIQKDRDRKKRKKEAQEQAKNRTLI